MLASNNRLTETDKRVDKDVEDVSFENRLFERLVAKSKRFTRVDFKYSIFESCYLRSCAFDSCDFTGCRFIGTNLARSPIPRAFGRQLTSSTLLMIGC